MSKQKEFSVREFALEKGVTTAYINRLISDGKIMNKHPDIKATKKIGKQNVIVKK